MKAAFGAATSVAAVFRGGDYAGIDEEASRTAAIGVAGPDAAAVDALIAILNAGALQPCASRAVSPDSIRLEVFAAGPKHIVDVYSAPSGEKRFKGSGLLDELSAEAVAAVIAPAIVDAADGDLVALARALPILREAAGLRLIGEVSRQNAKAAAMTNVVELVPVLGSWVGGVTDLIVLTRNQAAMVYRLAAIHGRPLGNVREILLELAPIVGAGFGWRTVARQLAGLMPFGLGMAPKVGVAFAGTYSLGRGAHYYFTHGSKPPRALLQQMARDLARLRSGGAAGSAATQRRVEAPPPSAETANSSRT